MNELLTEREINQLLRCHSSFGDDEKQNIFTEEQIITEEQKMDYKHTLSQGQVDFLRKEYKENNIKKPTVLIIDDAAFMRLMLRDILSKKGYEVVDETGSAQDGFEKFLELKPEIVIIDICMESRRSGIELIEKIKETKIPVYISVCSAVSTYEVVKQCFELGVDDFVAKPFQATRILPYQNKI